MATALRMLLVEDNPDDAELLLRELERGGFAVSWERVETADELRRQLLSGEWDLIISDYIMPRFSGMAALELARELRPELPFILTSGQVGEDIAVGAMRAGAQDYVLKNNLTRLAEAVRRELGEAMRRRSLKLAEQALRRSEERFRRLADNVPDVIFRFEPGPSAQVVYASPAVRHILGVSAQELYENRELLFHLVHPDDRATVERMMEGAELAGPAVFRFSRRGGQEVFLEMHAAAVREEGQVVAIEGIARDVTERVRMQERARRLELAGHLAVQVAHDFNNALVSLSIAAAQLEKRLAEDHPGRKYSEAIRRSVRTLSRLAENMLALGRRGLEPAPTDLNRVVRGVLERLDSRPDSLRLELRLAEGLPAVRGVSSQLERVLDNLVRNAREAMEDRGVLSITTRLQHAGSPFGRLAKIPAGDYVVIELGDTGSGIPVEQVERIFEPFFTTKNTDQSRGSGLGLTIVRSIVEDYGGYVDLESEVGQGTTFRVYLPRAGMEGFTAVEARETAAQSLH